ncbi:MAG: DUF819 family protein [Planctomycetota bacterium]|jgi:uncharacterized membrane protein
MVAAVLVDDPAGILAILLASLALIFWLSHHQTYGKIFKIIPSLVFCYFVPTTLTTLGVIPAESELYSWVKAHVLPASLLLLILSLDLPGIIRLGPKAGIMLLAGTFGVVIGGPISLGVMNALQVPLEEETWKGMAALCGSWIGGGANFVAMGDMVGASEAMIAKMVIPDVFVANIWMGFLLYCAGQQTRIDRWTGADNSAIVDLKKRMTAFQEETQRIPVLSDLMLIVALGFGGSWLSSVLAQWIQPPVTEGPSPLLGTTTWKYILVSTLGLALSFTRARNLEGAGASKVGSVLLYVLVACIGAHASFDKIVEAPYLLLMAGVWMSVHISVLLTVGWFIKAPIFFIAVGSQANIGGAASAPVVAASFHPSLATVGVLLAVAGYVICTYAGQVCIFGLKWIAGVQ